MLPATPERVATIKPAWVLHYIRSLETRIRSLESGTRHLAGRNEELEEQIRAFSREQQKIRTNVRVITGDTEMALPPDSAVVFNGRIEVSPSENDPDGIGIEIHRGGGALMILPEGDDIITVRARKELGDRGGLQHLRFPERPHGRLPRRAVQRRAGPRQETANRRDLQLQLRAPRRRSHQRGEAEVGRRVSRRESPRPARRALQPVPVQGGLRGARS